MRGLFFVALLMLPGPALAQVWTDPLAATAEEHRLANQRLNAQADERAAFARRQQIEAGLTVQALRLEQMRNNARDLTGLHRDDRDVVAEAHIRSGEYQAHLETAAIEEARRRADSPVAFAARHRVETELTRQRLALQRLENDARDPSRPELETRTPLSSPRPGEAAYAARSEPLAREAEGRRTAAAQSLESIDTWYYRSAPR